MYIYLWLYSMYSKYNIVTNIYYGAVGAVLFTCVRTALARVFVAPPSVCGAYSKLGVAVGKSFVSNSNTPPQLRIHPYAAGEIPVGWRRECLRK